MQITSKLQLPGTLWYLLALGLALRIGVIELRPPGTLLLAPDEPEYLAIAESVADGNGFSVYGDTTAYRDMLFPVVSGGVIALCGTEHAVFYLQVVLDLITALLLFGLARKWFTEDIAVLAAGGWLLYPAAILMTSLLLTETLFVFLWVLALFVYDRAERVDAIRPYIALGLTFGLLLLTRATGVILAAAILMVMVYRRRVGHALLVIAVMLAVTLPWMLRNSRMLGTLALNTNSGINLYIGNNPHATGAYRFDSVVTDTLNSADGEVARNGLATQLALNHVRTQPLETLMLWPKKFAYFWSSDMALWAHYLPKPESPSLAATLRAVPVVLLAVAALFYMAIVVLSAAELALNKAIPLRGILILQISLATLAALITYGLPRYHYPLMPALLLGGAGFIAAQPSWKQIARKPALILLLIVLACVWVAEILTIADL